MFVFMNQFAYNIQLTKNVIKKLTILKILDKLYYCKLPSFLSHLVLANAKHCSSRYFAQRKIKLLFDQERVHVRLHKLVCL